MNDTMVCPDCGTRNPAGSAACSRCNYPLGTPGAAVSVSPAGVPPESVPASEPESVGSAELPRPALRRPIRPPRLAQAQQALSIWLFVGGFAALLLIYIAVKANVDRALTPVEGSNQAQQQQAEEAQVVLARDSTNVDARQRLADIYYDTANWTEAAVHYRKVIAADSTRVTALVDLGVCHYNLGDPNEAERLFQLALRRDPHHPIALFNLGIVSERREDWEGALRYYHAAMQSDPPENMAQPLMQSIQRIQEKTGRSPKPLGR